LRKPLNLSEPVRRRNPSILSVSTMKRLCQQEDKMWCAKCQRDLSKCTCEDLEERLNSAVKAGSLAYRYCKKCNKHYAKCKCKNPKWGIKGG